jgi:hypothetical protein
VVGGVVVGGAVVGAEVVGEPVAGVVSGVEVPESHPTKDTTDKTVITTMANVFFIFSLLKTVLLKR